MTRKVRRIDWSPSEWLAGTRGVLTMRELAVYDVVLNQIYDRGNACPNDADFINGHFKPESASHRRSRAWLIRSTRAALDRLIEIGKLRLSNDGQWLTNGRADVELGKAGERIVGATRAGIASGASRRAKAALTPRWSRAESALTKPKSFPANGLARTSVRNHQPPSDHTLSENHTGAARDPAPEPQAAPGRAPIASNEGAKINTPTKPKSESQQRLEAAAAAARAKFMKGSR